MRYCAHICAMRSPYTPFSTISSRPSAGTNAAIMLSTAAVPEPVISTAVQSARIQPVHRQQALAGFVLQIEELRFAMAQIGLQQAAAHALRQRDGPGIEQQCISALRGSSVHSVAAAEVPHQTGLDLDRRDRRTRQIAGRAAADEQARKPRPVVRRRVQPRRDGSATSSVSSDEA